MHDFEPPKCECCGDFMLAGLGQPARICRTCSIAGAAHDPKYCSACKGACCSECGHTGLAVPFKMPSPHDEWNAAIEAAYAACMSCDGALNNAGACAVKVRALRRQ
jgi:hypothetical protein